MPPVLANPSLVLAGFIPDDQVRLRRALMLPDSAFVDQADIFLFRAFREYHRVHRGMLPIQYLAERLKTEPAETTQRIAERFKLLRDTPVEDHVFEYALTSTFEQWRDDEARAALASAARILVGSGEVIGEGEDAYTVRGYQAMRQHLGKAFSVLDAQEGGHTPEVELGYAYDSILAQHASALTDDRFRFATGIDVLDDALPYSGPSSGQFWFIAAYAGQGKTTFCTSALMHPAVLSGLNVVYFTGETLMEEVQLKLVGRHSRMPQFGYPSGIDTLAVRKGLPPEQLEVFNAAAYDLTSRSGQDYGRALIRQMPLKNTFDDVLATLERVEASWPVHVLIVDSIDMVLPPGRDSRRDKLNEAIEDFASLAVSYGGGRGLLVISPYQINRESYNRAIENKGRYELSALAETAMAERRASVVLSLLRLPDQNSTLRAQVLKNRHGSEPEFTLDVDYRSSYVGASAGVVASASDISF